MKRIKSGLQCIRYPRVDQGTFKEARSRIIKHFATCEDCQHFAKRFLYREELSGKILVRPARVEKWTHNGPTASLHRNPLKGFFVEAAKESILAATSGEEQMARILFFEYTLLWTNRHQGQQRQHRRKRRVGSGRPWTLGEVTEDDHIQQ